MPAFTGHTTVREPLDSHGSRCSAADERRRTALPCPRAPPVTGWLQVLAEQCSPFGPVPLQNLQPCRVGGGGADRPASARSLKRLVQFSRKPLSYVGRADWRRLVPPASDVASPVSSMPAQGLSQSELIRTSVIYSPGLHHLTPPHSTGPSPSGWSFGSNQRRRSMVAIRNLLF